MYVQYTERPTTETLRIKTFPYITSYHTCMYEVLVHTYPTLHIKPLSHSLINRSSSFWQSLHRPYFFLFFLLRISLSSLFAPYTSAREIEKESPPPFRKGRSGQLFFFFLAKADWCWCYVDLVPTHCDEGDSCKSWKSHRLHCYNSKTIQSKIFACNLPLTFALTSAIYLCTKKKYLLLSGAREHRCRGLARLRNPQQAPPWNGLWFADKILQAADTNIRITPSLA